MGEHWGIPLGGRTHSVSLYEDDLIYVKDITTHLTTLWTTLADFENAAGLKVNWDKSSIYPLHPNTPHREIGLGFVDLRSAFNRVLRARLWAKLKEWEIPHHLIDAIVALYSNTWARLKLGDGGNLSSEIKIHNGLKQGCVLAPCLFNIYLADLYSNLKTINGIPPKLAEDHIHYLQYADDIVVLSHTPIGLQRIINQLTNYLDQQGLEIIRKRQK